VLFTDACAEIIIIIIIITDLYSAFRSEDTRLNTLVYRKFELSRQGQTRHGHGLGSSMGWVGSEIFAYEMGWVGFICQKLIFFSLP